MNPSRRPSTNESPELSFNDVSGDLFELYQLQDVAKTALASRIGKSNERIPNTKDDEKVLEAYFTTEPFVHLSPIKKRTAQYLAVAKKKSSGNSLEDASTDRTSSFCISMKGEVGVNAQSRSASTWRGSAGDVVASQGTSLIAEELDILSPEPAAPQTQVAREELLKKLRLNMSNRSCALATASSGAGIIADTNASDSRKIRISSLERWRECRSNLNLNDFITAAESSPSGDDAQQEQLQHQIYPSQRDAMEAFSHIRSQPAPAHYQFSAVDVRPTAPLASSAPSEAVDGGSCKRGSKRASSQLMRTTTSSSSGSDDSGDHDDSDDVEEDGVVSVPQPDGLINEEQLLLSGATKPRREGSLIQQRMAEYLANAKKQTQDKQQQQQLLRKQERDAPPPTQRALLKAATEGTAAGCAAPAEQAATGASYNLTEDVQRRKRKRRSIDTPASSDCGHADVLLTPTSCPSMSRLYPFACAQVRTFDEVTAHDDTRKLTFEQSDQLRMDGAVMRADTITASAAAAAADATTGFQATASRESSSVLSDSTGFPSIHKLYPAIDSAVKADSSALFLEQQVLHNATGPASPYADRADGSNSSLVSCKPTATSFRLDHVYKDNEPAVQGSEFFSYSPASNQRLLTRTAAAEDATAIHAADAPSAGTGAEVISVNERSEQDDEGGDDEDDDTTIDLSIIIFKDVDGVEDAVDAATPGDEIDPITPIAISVDDKCLECDASQLECEVNIDGDGDDDASAARAEVGAEATPFLDYDKEMHSLQLRCGADSTAQLQWRMGSHGKAQHPTLQQTAERQEHEEHHHEAGAMNSDAKGAQKGAKLDSIALDLRVHLEAAQERILQNHADDARASAVAEHSSNGILAVVDAADAGSGTSGSQAYGILAGATYEQSHGASYSADVNVHQEEEELVSTAWQSIWSSHYRINAARLCGQLLAMYGLVCFLVTALYLSKYEIKSLGRSVLTLPADTTSDASRLEAKSNSSLSDLIEMQLHQSMRPPVEIAAAFVYGYTASSVAGEMNMQQLVTNLTAEHKFKLEQFAEETRRIAAAAAEKELVFITFEGHTLSDEDASTATATAAAASSSTSPAAAASVGATAGKEESVKKPQTNENDSSTKQKLRRITLLNPSAGAEKSRGENVKSSFDRSHQKPLMKVLFPHIDTVLTAGSARGWLPQSGVVDRPISVHNRYLFDAYMVDTANWKSRVAAAASIRGFVALSWHEQRDVLAHVISSQLKDAAAVMKTSLARLSHQLRQHLEQLLLTQAMRRGDLQRLGSSTCQSPTGSVSAYELHCRRSTGRSPAIALTAMEILGE